MYRIDLGAWLSGDFYDVDNAQQSSVASDCFVMMGDSISRHWLAHHGYLPKHGIITRGISGQSSYQILLRFRRDVVALRPVGVQIMAGTNDLFGIVGFVSEQGVIDNIRTMTEIAVANGIQVVLATLPPVTDVNVRGAVCRVNSMIESFARQAGFPLIDYFAALRTDDDGFDPAYSDDGVHPNLAGYDVMTDLALPIIEAVMLLHGKARNARREHTLGISLRRVAQQVEHPNVDRTPPGSSLSLTQPD